MGYKVEKPVASLLNKVGEIRYIRRINQPPSRLSLRRLRRHTAADAVRLTRHFERKSRGGMIGIGEGVVLQCAAGGVAYIGGNGDKGVAVGRRVELLHELVI